MDFRLYAQDASPEESHSLLELDHLLREAFSNLGRELDVADHFENLLRDHGFRNIQHRRISIPMGFWPEAKEFVSCTERSSASYLYLAIENYWDYAKS